MVTHRIFIYTRFTTSKIPIPAIVANKIRVFSDLFGYCTRVQVFSFFFKSEKIQFGIRV